MQDALGAWYCGAVLCICFDGSSLLPRKLDRLLQALLVLAKFSHLAGSHLQCNSNNKIDDSDRIYCKHGDHQLHSSSATAGQREWGADDDGGSWSLKWSAPWRHHLGALSHHDPSRASFSGFSSCLSCACGLLVPASPDAYPH